jgi:predicted Abi (CAAX) family protease
MYVFSITRIIRKNRGDKFIEFGSLTLMAFLLWLWLRKLPGIPDWLLGSIVVLMYSLCLLALGFMFQQIYRAVRNKLVKHTE